MRKIDPKVLTNLETLKGEDLKNAIKFLESEKANKKLSEIYKSVFNELYKALHNVLEDNNELQEVVSRLKEAESIVSDLDSLSKLLDIDVKGIMLKRYKEGETYEYGIKTTMFLILLFNTEKQNEIKSDDPDHIINVLNLEKRLKLSEGEDLHNAYLETIFEILTSVENKLAVIESLEQKNNGLIFGVDKQQKNIRNYRHGNIDGQYENSEEKKFLLNPGEYLDKKVKEVNFGNGLINDEITSNALMEKIYNKLRESNDIPKEMPDYSELKKEVPQIYKFFILHLLKEHKTDKTLKALAIISIYDALFYKILENVGNDNYEVKKYVYNKIEEIKRDFNIKSDLKGAVRGDIDKQKQEEAKRLYEIYRHLKDTEGKRNREGNKNNLGGYI
ncbi:MAG: hypothetical protein ACP5RT_01055 [Candidatus Micrarchaeia archaeon]